MPELNFAPAKSSRSLLMHQDPLGAYVVEPKILRRLDFLCCSFNTRRCWRSIEAFKVISFKTYSCKLDLGNNGRARGWPRSTRAAPHEIQVVRWLAKTVSNTGVLNVEGTMMQRWLRGTHPRRYEFLFGQS